LWHTAAPESARVIRTGRHAKRFPRGTIVNEPEDKGPKPESTEPPATSGVWLPPRLREKLDAPSSGDDFDFLKRKTSPVPKIITAVVVVAVLAGAWMVFQSNQKKAAAAAAAKAAEARAVVVADSLAHVRMTDSLAAIVRADSIAFAALPKWKQRQILAEKAKKAAAASGATASAPATTGASGGAAAAGGAGAAAGGEATQAAPETPAEAGPFGIDAGQYLDETRAGEVAATLKEKTGLAAAVVAMGQGEEQSFHVVLGSYPRRSAAESKASSLLSKGLVGEASIVALPKAP
jgi:hypothetical protein